MPYNPKGYFDSLRAGTETALSMGGNAFFDIGALGATALTDLPLWLQGFGNKEASEEFRRRKDRRRSQLPELGVSQRTEEYQKAIAEPVIESAKEGWEWFSEKNPNAAEALVDYISDPRVLHTLDSSIFAAPSLARMGKAMSASRKSGQAMDSLRASSPSGAPGKQQGAIDFFGQELYHASKQDIPKGEFKPGYEDGLIFLTPDPEFANQWLGKGKYTKRLNKDPDEALYRDPSDYSDEYQQEYDTQRQARDDIQREMGVYDAMDRWDKARDEKGLDFTDDDPNKADFFRLTEDAKKRFNKEYPVSPDKIHGTIYPVRANVRNAFHPDEDWADMDDWFKTHPQDRALYERQDNFGNYLLFEKPEMVKYLKDKGYDGMYLKESTWDKDSPYTTVAAFDPKGIESTFDFDAKQKGMVDFFDNSLPMDEESVMERATAMGFLTDAYHGSTHDLTEFDADLSSPEGDWGRSVYSTTSKRDASINYAGEGGDLTNRISRRSEEIADSLMNDDLEFLLEGTGISVDDFMKDEAGAIEKLARMELVGDAEHGVIYPLKVNTSDYAVIGRKPTRLEEPDYWSQAKEDIDANDYDHVEDYEDAIHERVDELRADDPDHPLARVQAALEESSIWDDEMARQSVMEKLFEYDPGEGLDISDIDQAIRDEYITAYDDMGDMVSSGGISAEVLKNLGFKGVIDETVNAKFGQGRRFGGGMEGIDYDTKHIITFPGNENTIRSRYARFDPANKHKKDIRGMVDFFGGSDVDPYTKANATIAAALMGDTDIRREGFPGADINSFTSVTRPRYKQYQEDMGYYEPSIFGDTKLTTPVHKMSRIVSDYGDPLDKRIIRPEDLQGESIFPLFGDRSQTGARLWGINDHFFDSPVDLTGGYDYMRYNPGEIWASGDRKVSTLNNRIRSAHDQGQEAFGVYMPQAVGASDFNDMTLKAVRHGIAGLDLSPSVKNDFDNTVRKFRKEWTSIDDPMMSIALQNNGELRKNFLKVAGQKRFAEHGFPSLQDAIYAVTDPKIMHTPLYHGGQSIGHATGKRWESGHGTYNTSMGGDYFGGFEKPIPGEIMFKDFFDKKRAEGKTGDALNRSFYLSEPNQEMTQEIVDALSEYLGY